MASCVRGVVWSTPVEVARGACGCRTGRQPRVRGHVMRGGALSHRIVVGVLLLFEQLEFAGPVVLFFFLFFFFAAVAVFMC